MARPARILITGATGQVGSEVLSRLVGVEGIEAVAASRSAGVSVRGATTIRLDFDDPTTLATALEGIDRLFLLTGYMVDMLRQSKAVVDEAEKAGVKHIVHLGACGADDTDVAHYGWHQFVERYIAGSGIAHTHLRPEIFMQNLLGYGGVPVADHGVLRYYVGDARLSWIDASDIAEVAATVLKSPRSHSGRTYRLGSDAKTYGEIARIIEKTTGQAFRYEARPAEEFLADVLARGGEPAYMDCVYRSFKRLSEGGIPGSDDTFDTFTAVTGKEAATIADFVRRHVDRFRY